MQQTPLPNLHALLETPLTQKLYQASGVIPRRQQWRFLTLALILNDLIALGAAFRVSFYVRFELGLAIFAQDAIPTLRFYQNLVMVFLPVWLVIFTTMGLYNRQKLLGGTQEYSTVFSAATIGMFSVITAGFLFPELIFARGWLVLSWGFAFFFTALGRFLVRRAVYYLRDHGFYLSPTIIVGANDEGISLGRQLSTWKSSGLYVLGYVDSKLPAGTLVCEDDDRRSMYCLGPVDRLDEVIGRYEIEEVILASSAFSSRDNLLEIFKTYGVASGVNVRLSSGLYEIITTGLTVKEFAYVPLVGVNQVRLTGLDRVLKLILDYTLTVLALVIALPIMLLTALAIRLDSPGPVIHRRRVMGVNGKQFDAFKFRTMRVDGDALLAARPDLLEELRQNHKLKYDPRITRLGAFLRRSSLDELPQLLNVLRGEMSLVGPRMISPAEIDKYDKWDINLLTVRPGITGLWQVSGRSDISYEQRVRLDMHYIRNWSIWLDLQLIFQTIPAVLKSRGAY